MNSGEGVIKGWLEYCHQCEQRRGADTKTLVAQLSRAQSEFEQQVLTALSVKGFDVIAQYPSCGYFIDIVAQRGNTRVAIECDGEFWHLDEHGEQKIEDIERQEVLERAGWRVLRIPYRSWRENSSSQIDRIVFKLQSDDDPGKESSEALTSVAAASVEHCIKTIAVDSHEKAIVDALREGVRSRAFTYRLARETLGYGNLGPVIRAMLDDAVRRLEKKGAITVEEDEVFFKSQEMRDSIYEESLPAPIRPEKPRLKKSYPQSRYRRRW